MFRKVRLIPKLIREQNRLNKNRLISFVQSNPKTKHGQLLNVLDQEINFETRQMLEVDKYGKMLSKEGWVIDEHSEGVKVRMQKNINDEFDVTIVFNAKNRRPYLGVVDDAVDGLKNNEPEAEDEDTENKNKADAFQTSFILNVGMYIVRKKNHCMFVDLIISDDNYLVSSIDFIETNDMKSHQEKYLAKNSNIWETEKHDALEFEIKKEFSEFLESICLNPEFVTRIQRYSMAKDQKVYIDFMKKFKNILSI